LALTGLGEVAREQEDYAAAGVFYADSLELYREMGYKMYLGWPLHNLGHVAQHVGAYGEALACFTESLVLFQDQGDQQGVAACLAGVVGVVGAQGYGERAAWLFGAAAALLDASKTRLDSADRIAFDHNLQVARAHLNVMPSRLPHTSFRGAGVAVVTST
jgi:tetratricopeptide (TPR) repeat protein